MDRHIYDCDTYDYWCSDEAYNDRDKKFGQFIDNGKGYEIFDKNTPRPWLNYLCNDKIASAFTNTGLGFFWYKSSLLRITKFEHPIDYQPRTFEDGREVIITDLENNKTYNIFRDAKDVHCIHRPGYSAIDAEIDGIHISMTVFVPKEDSCECWIVKIKSNIDRKINIKFEQIWSIARFGIHTAEDGIPYISTPGKGQIVEIKGKTITAHSNNKELPVEIFAFFGSPDIEDASVRNEVQTRKDGRVFTFPICTLSKNIELKANKEEVFNIASGAEEDENLFEILVKKYENSSEFEYELAKVKEMWEKLILYPSCSIPDKNLESFLNVWFKNQMYVTFRYVRSGYIGYRDTIQDSWGYTLLEPKLAKNQIIKTLSYMKKDGTCPRNFSPYGFSDKHDLRNTMDSITWIGMCLCDYIKETGDFEILNEKIRYLDDENLETVEKHIWKAFECLYDMRGLNGFNLVIDGDWNDAIEGMSKSGPAVSVWLSMATYYGQNKLSEIYSYIGNKEKSEILTARSEELKNVINEHGWDGEWYIYAFSGKGNPVGSHSNKGGKIHLNSNTWAVFTGVADSNRADKARNSIKKHLDTPLGPALLAPPYGLDEDEVGRIINLEPGTFENASVYQHAVTFKIFADLFANDFETAYTTFANLLPTNPDNFDLRRESEPYCTGNYYCGPSHKRFGQNFFTWFTGNASWLLRAGFDELLGVKAEFAGLKILPKVPKSWNEYSVKKIYRGTLYNINFKRAKSADEVGIFVDGVKIDGNIIEKSDKKEQSVLVIYD